MTRRKKQAALSRAFNMHEANNLIDTARANIDYRLRLANVFSIMAEKCCFDQVVIKYFSSAAQRVAVAKFLPGIAIILTVSTAATA